MRLLRVLHHIADGLSVVAADRPLLATVRALAILLAIASTRTQQNKGETREDIPTLSSNTKM